MERGENGFEILLEECEFHQGSVSVDVDDAVGGENGATEDFDLAVLAVEAQLEGMGIGVVEGAPSEDAFVAEAEVAKDAFLDAGIAWHEAELSFVEGQIRLGIDEDSRGECGDAVGVKESAGELDGGRAGLDFGTAAGDAGEILPGNGGPTGRKFDGEIGSLVGLQELSRDGVRSDGEGNSKYENPFFHSRVAKARLTDTRILRDAIG